MWYLILLFCTVECDMPVHVNDQHVQWNVALLVASHNVLKLQSVIKQICMRGCTVVTLPFPQCRHRPSIENRKLQKHILVEWEFYQQPTQQ